MDQQQKRHRKLLRRLSLVHLKPHGSSETSISSTTDVIHPLRFPGGEGNRRRLSHSQHKSDHLTRIFNKKKLKDKSLSKKMKTPFDRKVNRTCWPIHISKVSKIKKKPKEKRKEKPTYRSIHKKKFSKPNYSTQSPSAGSSDINCSINFLDEESFEELLRNLNHFLYEPVTPQMLMEVLQDPEHLKAGASLDAIIAKLRALKLGLNPTVEMLKQEVALKLKCAIKLGLVIECNGYYIIANTLRMKKLTRKKVDAFWELWYRQMAKYESEHR